MTPQIAAISIAGSGSGNILVVATIVESVLIQCAGTAVQVRQRKHFGCSRRMQAEGKGYIRAENV